MKKVICLLAFSLISFGIMAQGIYITRTGQVSFYSETPIENIEGINNEVTSMINADTGEIVFAILVKGFHFEKALMEEHFNENYMESGKIPKSTFQGKIKDLSKVDFKKEGNYPVSVEGDLTIHGVKKAVTAMGTLTVKKEGISVLSSFDIQLEDFEIEIPSLVADKIAKEISIKVNCAYKPKS
ncbi:YceI family protein [Cognataquiflexum aquatile]|uniref:YceI family protein n=1 Tax=Cognataquiflexum aquatile TaxID=2249427 RepID=UPI000DE92497|nr:YceI family protein [Cognataquiflexum aquatile]